MFYGTRQFDPIFITAQIASVQCIFYITLGALLWLLVGEHSAEHRGVNARDMVSQTSHDYAAAFTRSHHRKAYASLLAQQLLGASWGMVCGSVKRRHSSLQCSCNCLDCK